MARRKKSDIEEPASEKVTKIVIDEPAGAGEQQQQQEEDEEPGTRQRQPIEVRSALLKDSMFCQYTYDHTVAPNTTNEVKCKSAVPIHKDLSIAFARLNPHLAVICDEISIEQVGDIENLPTDQDDPLFMNINRFTVSAFTLDGIDGLEGVNLIGQKSLSAGDHVDLKAPKKRWDCNYHYINELRVAIMDIIHEVELYMGGKQAPKQQISMFDDSEVSTSSKGRKGAEKEFSLTTAGGRLQKADPDAMKRVMEEEDEYSEEGERDFPSADEAEEGPAAKHGRKRKVK